MRKIPTLFVRTAEDRAHVTRDVTPGCEWVIDGEGVATRKYDGSCFMLNGATWWARREVRPGKPEPDGFVPVEVDSVTGKAVGWEPADSSGFIKFLREALQDVMLPPIAPGTYELCGPRVNGNPEHFDRHVLIRHEDAQVVADAPRDFEGLRSWLCAHPYEGIVWHHDDGRMAKLKRRDFR